MTFNEDKLCNDSRCEFNRKGITHKILEHEKLERIWMMDYKPPKQDSKLEKTLGLSFLSLMIILFASLFVLMFLNGKLETLVAFGIATMVFTGIFIKYLFEIKNKKIDY